MPGVSPTNVGGTQLFAETSAVPGRRPVGRQPAQLLEQLHRRWPVGQRRRGRTERHPVWRRCRRPVPGRDLGRPGRARTRARRLRQRRDAQRHQRCRAATSTATSATTRSTRRNALSGTKLPMYAEAVRRQPRRSDRARPDVLLRQRRAAAARSDRARDDHAMPTSPIDQRPAGGGRLSGLAGRRRASIRTRSTA